MENLVSVNCITYNHENSIAEAIEGFLSQITNFNFEILIGEDCSTDNTRNIVSEYAGKYKSKIRLITSERNVGAWENSQRLFMESQGKYIALCEGDDLWTDPYKLQKQIDYLEKNRDCTLIFHNAEKIKQNGVKTGKLMIHKSVSSGIYDAGQVTRIGFIPTASIICRKNSLIDPPEWYTESVVGDLPLLLIATSKGHAYYQNEVMSYYRIGQKESSAGKFLRETDDRKVLFFQEIIKILDNFNSYTRFKYSKDINLTIQEYIFRILITKRDLEKITSKDFIVIYKSKNMI